MHLGGREDQKTWIYTNDLALPVNEQQKGIHVYTEHESAHAWHGTLKRIDSEYVIMEIIIVGNPRLISSTTYFK